MKRLLALITLVFIWMSVNSYATNVRDDMHFQGDTTIDNLSSTAASVETLTVETGTIETLSSETTTITGDQVFSGSGSGLAYGQMTNDLGNAVNISLPDTWYEVTSGFSTGLVHLATFSGTHYISVTNAGKYKVHVYAALSGGAAGDEVGVAVMVNGEAVDAGHAHSSIGNPSDNTAMGTSAIVSLSANDQVSVSVINHTAARNLNLEHCSITLFQIGG